MNLVEDIHALAALDRVTGLGKGWQRFSAPSELVAHISSPDERIKHVIRRLTTCKEHSGGSISNRVVNAASRLVCGTNNCDSALRRVVLRDKPYNLLEWVKPLRLDLVGYIYFAKSPLRPSTLKIGFTTRIPEVRVRSLMANSGEELILLGSFVGTLLDEQIFHFLNEKEKVAGEWYFKPARLPNLPFLETGA